MPSSDMSWDDELLLPCICSSLPKQTLQSWKSPVFLHSPFGVRNSDGAGCWRGMWAISRLFMTEQLYLGQKVHERHSRLNPVADIAFPTGW